MRIRAVSKTMLILSRSRIFATVNCSSKIPLRELLRALRAQRRARRSASSRCSIATASVTRPASPRARTSPNSSSSTGAPAPQLTHTHTRLSENGCVVNGAAAQLCNKWSSAHTLVCAQRAVRSEHKVGGGGGPEIAHRLCDQLCAVRRLEAALAATGGHVARPRALLVRPANHTSGCISESATRKCALRAAFLRP